MAEEEQTEEQLQLIYRMQCAVDAMMSGMPEEDRQRMQLIAEGQPEMLLERLRREDPTNIWDSAALREEFEVQGFRAPLVSVRRRSTGEMGLLMFTHLPRWYFGWMAVGE